MQITVDYNTNTGEGCAYLNLHTAYDTELKVLEKICEARPSIGCAYYQNEGKGYFHWFEVYDDYIRCNDLNAAKWLVQQTKNFYK